MTLQSDLQCSKQKLSETSASHAFYEPCCKSLPPISPLTHSARGCYKLTNYNIKPIHKEIWELYPLDPQRRIEKSPLPHLRKTWTDRESNRIPQTISSWSSRTRVERVDLTTSRRRCHYEFLFLFFFYIENQSFPRLNNEVEKGVPITPTTPSSFSTRACASLDAIHNNPGWSIESTASSRQTTNVLCGHNVSVTGNHRAYWTPFALFSRKSKMD